jgi:predicted transcriptional regulator
MLPDWIVARDEISFGAKVLFAYLVRRWNPRLRCAWPSQQNIATALGIRPRHVRNLVREIRDAGLVETQRRAIKPSGWRKAHVQTIYTFSQHHWMTGAGKTRTQQQQEAGEAALQDGDDPL